MADEITKLKEQLLREQQRAELAEYQLKQAREQSIAVVRHLSAQKSRPLVLQHLTLLGSYETSGC